MTALQRCNVSLAIFAVLKVMVLANQEVRYVPMPRRTIPGYFVIESIKGSLPGATGEGLLARIETAIKLNADDRPYAVANEYIAARLAYAAGLPVPPGEIVRLADGRIGYVCLMFKPDGVSLPPVIPSELVQQDPNFCMGVILFDMWIRNGIDRHDENLAYMSGVGGSIFDHDTALLGYNRGKAVEELRNAKAQSCVDGHCLIRDIHTLEHAHEWAARMAAVPQSLIRESAAKVFGFGLINAAERDEVISFLAFRKDRLLEYLGSSRALFRNVSMWPLIDGESEAGER
ncbi:hypothetical protein [Streptosporangium sp. NBC_01756]|uniref:hypothetical protein n=1 Tax=Streptosporangium sp. NBC_01756 TaxID=2975950 RepID=UPI002DD8F1FD|nr:hypothetical protein [Streptosporangium sp. NBC_01756]WSC89463.1 HipA domain-containing protein [Streptosporangium sp. NBC_01756]